MRRPAVREGPEMSAVLAFAPRERACEVDGQSNDSSRGTTWAAGCRIDEKSGTVQVGGAHGFLGKCHGEEPAECERLRTAASL